MLTPAMVCKSNTRFLFNYSIITFCFFTVFFSSVHLLRFCCIYISNEKSVNCIDVVVDAITTNRMDSTRCTNQYTSSVLLGNWFEDVVLQEVRVFRIMLISYTGITAAFENS